MQLTLEAVENPSSGRYDEMSFVKKKLLVELDSHCPICLYFAGSK